MERSFKQTLQEVTVSVPLDPPTRAKFLDVSIRPTSLSVATKLGPTRTLLDGELFAEVAPGESTWWVEDNAVLLITLEKKNQQQWWPHVLTTDPKIDVTQLAPEQSKLSDLDPQTRASVEKMMFDQQQKQRGLPTSEETRKQKTFDRFKEMHPELDFSKVKPSFDGA